MLAIEIARDIVLAAAAAVGEDDMVSSDEVVSPVWSIVVSSPCFANSGCGKPGVPWPSDDGGRNAESSLVASETVARICARANR
jgi:hypothetical protein